MSKTIDALRDHLRDWDAMQHQNEDLRSILDNLTLRLALRQLREGPLPRLDDPRWDAVLALVQLGRLSVGPDGCVLLDGLHVLGCGQSPP